MKIIARITTVLLLLVMLNACKKSYITGGVPDDVNAYVNQTTYEVLTNAAHYDTLMKVIDAANFKDMLNTQSTTFFAPNNAAIASYLAARTAVVQNTDKSLHFGLDSLLYYITNNINGTRDSLKMYLVATALPYSALNSIGMQYPTQLAGDSVVVSYEYSTSVGYNTVSAFVSSTPQVVYLTQLWHPYTISPTTPANKIPASIGVHTLCSTSGVKTKNGILNALGFGHILFFYGTKQ